MLKKLILIGSSALFFASPFSSYARVNDIENRLLIQSIIVRESAVYGVDPGLAIFIAANESGFYARAKSKVSTASGIFQWVKNSWLGICVKGYKIADEHADVFDPVLNIRCAMRTIADGGLSHWLADPIMRRKLLKAGFITEHGALAANLIY